MQLCRGTIIDWIVTQSERDLVCEVKLFAGIILLCFTECGANMGLSYDDHRAYLPGGCITDVTVNH